MKTVDRGILLLACLSFCACSPKEEPADSGNDISVQFTANRFKSGAQVNENPLSVLIFKKVDSGKFAYFPREDDSRWETSESGLIKKIILPAGTYRFLLAKGFSTESGTGNCQFVGEENSSGGYDKDYFFCYPSENVSGMLKLKPCLTELFTDANEKGFEPNQTEYLLTEGNRFSVLRKITRLQGRIDFLIRRGQRKADGTLVTLQEGPDNEFAREYALKKIHSVQITTGNVSSRCHLSGLSFSTPGDFSFDLSVKDFASFNSGSFTAEFDGVDQAGYSAFENSAYSKGPLLFPAPGEEDIKVDVVFNYVYPLAPKKVSTAVKLERNRAVLVILWLLNEEVGTEVTLSPDELEFENGSAIGDDGFWN